MKHTLYLLITYFLFSISAVHANSDVFSIPNFNQSSCADEIALHFAQPCMLAEITCDIDGMYNSDDLLLLIGLQPNTVVSCKDIAQAAFYIRQLGIFESVLLQGYVDELQQYHLTLTAQQKTVLDYVNVAGFLRGKQKLKQLYVMDPGEVFDHSKHLHSIEMMKKNVQQLGYLKAEIHDALLPENKQKAVVVHCGVDLGKRFSIGKVYSVVTVAPNTQSVDVPEISKFVQSIVSRKLERKYYQAELVDAVKKKLKDLLRQKGFTDIDICVGNIVFSSHQTVDLRFEVHLEKKREFVFCGNIFFKHDEIMQHLLLYGKSCWCFPSVIIIDEIEQLYKSKGFFDVSVSVQQESVYLFCTIKEGVRSGIRDLFLLNASYDQGKILLKKAFEHCYKKFYYDQELFKKAIDDFVKSYKKAGYWDIKILQQQPIARNHKEFDYQVMVQEGYRRLAGTIFVEFDTDVQTAFRKVFSTLAGQGFDYFSLSEQKQWLLQYFKNKGYQSVMIKHRLVESPVVDGASTVDVFWDVQLSGGVVTFGSAIILGNSKASYQKLLKEVDCVQGCDWNKNDIDTTIQNFKETGLFQSIQVYPGSQIDEYGGKPLFITLIDADRYEVKTRFGLQQVGKNLQFKHGFTYKVGAGIKCHRLFSHSDTFDIDCDMTKYYRNFYACYKTPWLFNRRVRGEFRGYDNLYLQPVYIGSQYSLYKGLQQGLLYNVSHNKKSFTYSCSLGAEFLGLYQADQPCLESIIRYDKSLLGHKIGFLFLEPTIMWRRVDNLLRPKSGTVSLITSKMMFDLKHKTSFCKLQLEHSWYVPLSLRVIGALRLRLGHVFNQNFCTLHPIERFYLGGASSIRGYERDYCPPFGKLTCPIHDDNAALPAQAHGIWRYAPQGGRTMANINLETRCNVYKNFDVVLFTDMGALFQDSIFKKESKHCPHFFGASGFGVRYDTPIGPLRFDIGFKWRIDRPDFESRHVLYLTLGQAF